MASASTSSTSNTIYSNVQVPLFEGENYDFWAVKMETLFTSLDVLDLIKTENAQPKTEPTAAESEELKKKKIVDAGVLGMIQRGVSFAIFPRIMRSKDSQGGMGYSTVRF